MLRVSVPVPPLMLVMQFIQQLPKVGPSSRVRTKVASQNADYRVLKYIEAYAHQLWAFESKIWASANSRGTPRQGG